MKQILFLLISLTTLFLQSSAQKKKIIEYKNMEYGVFDSSGTKMFFKISEEAADTVYRRELDSMAQNNLDTMCVDFIEKYKEEWEGINTKKITSISEGILCVDTSDNTIVLIPEERIHVSYKKDTGPRNFLTGATIIMIIILIVWPQRKRSSVNDL